jgi:REP element-mobilizing transposase RayT
MADPPVRKPTRAPGFDYREPGPYFVTICEHRRISRFGVIVDEDMQPNASGEMILSAWRSLPTTFPTATLDAFVLMPNHFHALIMLSAEDVETNPSLSAIVQWFKTVTTKRYIQGMRKHGWRSFDGHLWQGSFHDRIVRNERELDRIRRYIDGNPAMWE